MGANGSLQAVFSVDRNESEIKSLEHVVLTLSLTIKNYTSPRSLSQYHIIQSLLGTHFDQADINNILEHRGARRGNVKITLTSPSGTESILLPRRRKDFVNTGTLSWSFMSVLHWGENPVGQWTLTVYFNSTEGHVSLSGLNVTLYGISEPSVESVSDACSSECRDRCARSGPGYCDSCSHYRNAQSLTCLASCNSTGSSYEVHGGYCIPLATHTNTGISVTTSKVSIPLHSSETHILPTPTTPSNTDKLLEQSRHQMYAGSHSPAQMYTNQHSLTDPGSPLQFPESKFLPNTATTASIEGTTLRQQDAVMMTSALLLPTRASASPHLRRSTTTHTFRPTNKPRETDISPTDRGTDSIANSAVSAIISSTNFLVSIFLLFTACCCCGG